MVGSRFVVLAILLGLHTSFHWAALAIGKAVARLTGGFQTQGEKQVMNLRLSAPDMPIDELETMLPAFGMVLPSGSELKGGTLSVDLAISGPLDRLVFAGPVRMSNTKLAGFDMGSKLGPNVEIRLGTYRAGLSEWLSCFCLYHLSCKR